MMRRPATREGAMLPRFALTMVALLAGGVLAVATDRGPQLTEAGYWGAAVGGVGVVTSGLLFWRVMHGALVAAPLWVLLMGAFAWRISAPGGAGGWLIAAGALMVASGLLVAVNRHVGGGLSAGLWLGYAALVLRAVPASLEAHAWWWVPGLAAVAAVVATLAKVSLSRSSSRGLLHRLGRAGRESDGLATGWDVWRASSARVLRGLALEIRPSFGDLSWWRRRQVALAQLGVKVARVGRVWLWSSDQNHTITLGGPRKGKTQLLVNYVLDAVGPVLTTSTKTDILRATRARREQLGPVWVFDPSALTETGSTLRFDPLAGCQDPAVATDRAADLIDGIGRGKGDVQGERWDGFAKSTLKALLHAAALGGYSLRDVQQWVAHPSPEAMSDVMYVLRELGDASMTQDARQFFTNNPNTQSSISTGIMPALSWLSVPSAVASAIPEVGSDIEPLDIDRLLNECGTIYLLGAEDKKTAPLVTAFTAHIARTAKAIADRSAAGRLDPPLRMVLDEAALICLIPLDVWSGDFGGRGIPMHISAQSRAQLRQRYGDAATGALMTNCSVKVLFGGTGDDDDLKYWSTLAGEREETALTTDRVTGGRSETTRRVPVLTPGQVAELRAQQVLVISNEMPPVITKARMAYQRMDVRMARFRNRPVVSWTTTRAAAAEDWAGARLITATSTFREASFRTAERIEQAVHRAVVAVGNRALDRFLAGLEWLDTRDPARELVARLRLLGAMRKARTALATRGTGRTSRAAMVGRRDDTDSQREQDGGRS